MKRVVRSGVLLAAVAAALAVMHAPVAAQTSSKAAKSAKSAKSKDKFKRFPDGTPNIEGYWETTVFFSAFDLEEHKEATFEVPAGPGVVVDPPDGKIPYQPWALERKKDLVANHLYEDPQAHCFLSGVPRQIYTPFGFQILQPPEAVLLAFEAFHAYRILHLGGKHPDPAIKLFQGDSRARWEGDTLVVETRNLNGRTWFDMEANFHGDNLTVVERFTPIDENTIRYRATMTEPEVYTRPWTIEFDLARNPDPDYELLEYACVEGEQDLQHYTESVGGRKQDAK
jgi:hypothetical protein